MIDASAAQALPGVKAVVTSKDFVELTAGQATAMGTATARDFFLSQEVIARDKAFSVGHAIAVVAATTREIAKHALSLIDVCYEPLLHVLDYGEAMQAGPPLLHDALMAQSPDGISKTSWNLAEHLVYQRGNMDGSFGEAHSIIESHFKTGSVHHGYIEPDSQVVPFDADGTVTVWANTQSIYT